MSDLVKRLCDLAQAKHDDLSVGNEAAAEITRLRAELATARREGMEEAAKIADREPELVGAMPAEFEKFSRETLARAASIATKRGIAAAIRAAAKEDRPSEEIIREDRDAWPDHQANDPIRAAAKEGE